MAVGRLAAVTLDCSDVRTLANFYHAAIGLEVAHLDDDGAYLSGDGIAMAMQRVADYSAPMWPSQSDPQQLHLDIAVHDLDEAERVLIELGAVKPEEQPNAEKWRVLLDPAGHPFCIANF